MIISNEQARLTAREITAVHHDASKTHEITVPASVIDAAVRVACASPEVRMDRVAQARARLEAGAIDSRAIAEKILARSLCDGLG
jgi:hypothetical protein